nr:hypothetical protein [Candidatus Njordarchaeum guaymaensis]
MAEKPALTRLLKANAGISDEAALVYKYVLMVGTLTIGEVCEYTGFEFDVASKTLKELVDGRLIRKLEHVVDRYVPVAPYRVFAEHLVDFQRTIREVEENTRKSIYATLAEISRVIEEWKGSATHVREEELSRTKQETSRLKEEFQSARNSLVEKLRHETEEKKSSISEALKKHVEEHVTRVSGIKKDVTLRLDNSVIKFIETTEKLKEEVAQAASSYLSRFDEKIKLFLNAINADLSTFQSELFSSAEKFQGEVSAILEEWNTKIGEFAETVRTRTNALLREVGQTYGQLSTELQRTVSSDFSSTSEGISLGNKELESNLKGVFQGYGEKLNENINSFQTETHEAIDVWRSAYKGELESQAKYLKMSIDSHQQSLTPKLESTKTTISELLKTYSTNAKSAGDELGSNLSGITESIKKDLSSKLGASKDELQESCDIAAKNCITLASILESLSKKNILLTSKTIKDFTLDSKDKLSKMKATFVEDAESFMEEIKERVLKTLLAAKETTRSAGNVPASARGKDGDPPSESEDDPPSATRGRGKKTDATRAKSLLLKEATKRIDEAGKTYIEAMKKIIDTLEKSTSERISTVLRFEDGLATKWESIITTMSKVTELAESIKLFPSEIGKPADELIEKYGEKVNVSLSSTRRLLNVYLSSLGDQASGTLKKWSITVDKTKKELSDLFIKKQEEIGGFVSKQIAVMQNIAADRGKELADLASSKIESFKSQSSTAQSTITKQVASNTESTRGSLMDIENKLTGDLEASAKEFTQKIESECKENDDTSARVVDETAKAVTNLKEQFNSIVDREKIEVKQICEDASSELKETTSENSRELRSIVSSLTGSFSTILDEASEGYKKECESIKATIITVLSEHLKSYTEAVTMITGEVNSTFSRHFDDCNEMTGSFGRKLDELLTAHQTGYEESSNKMLRGLANCIDRGEAAINQNANRMLKEFTDNTTRIAKESNSVETFMRTAWAEITDTQQINADKTWHYVTRRAILNHLKDMVKRTKSTVTIVVPNLDEVPLKEIKEISKAIRINIVAGVDEILHKKLLKELLAQGNVRIWNLAEKDYISCTRDAEEVLIAPVAKRDLDCVATASVEENYVKLYHKFIGPMWMASSREIKEKELR